MTNQALYIWLQQAQDFLETILKFISDNKDAFIVVLGAGSLPLAVRFIWSLIQQRRKRRILPDTLCMVGALSNHQKQMSHCNG
jgi:hypothetical protein